MGGRERQPAITLIQSPNETIKDDCLLKENQSIGLVRKNILHTVLAVLFLFGLLMGSFFLTQADSSLLNALDYLFFGSISARMNSSLFLVFLSSMTSSFLFLLFSFFCGLSMWGAAVEPAVVLTRGFGLGITAGYVYSFGASGIVCYLLLMLPGAFFTSIAILSVAVEGIEFSRRMNAARRSQTRKQAFVVPPSVKNYCIRCNFYGCLAIIGAILDVCTAFLFAGLFQNRIF